MCPAWALVPSQVRAPSSAGLSDPTASGLWPRHSQRPQQHPHTVRAGLWGLDPPESPDQGMGGACSDPLERQESPPDRPGDPAQKLLCLGVGSPWPSGLGQGLFTGAGEHGPPVEAPQDHRLRPGTLALVSACSVGPGRRPWHLLSRRRALCGGGEPSPSAQGSFWCKAPSDRI